MGPKREARLISHTLPGSRRLKRGGDFLRLKSQGRRVALGCLVLNWMALPRGSQGSRLGVITAKSLGNAVTRTRARRLLREAFRLHQHELAAPIDLVLVARASIRGMARAEVERDFLLALGRGQLLARRPDPEGPASEEKKSSSESGSI